MSADKGSPAFRHDQQTPTPILPDYAAAVRRLMSLPTKLEQPDYISGPPARPIASSSLKWRD